MVKGSLQHAASCGQQQGNGQNVCRHSLERLHVSMTKEKKIRLGQPQLCQVQMPTTSPPVPDRAHLIQNRTFRLLVEPSLHMRSFEFPVWDYGSQRPCCPHHSVLPPRSPCEQLMPPFYLSAPAIPGIASTAAALTTERCSASNWELCGPRPHIEALPVGSATVRWHELTWLETDIPSLGLGVPGYSGP